MHLKQIIKEWILSMGPSSQYIKASATQPSRSTVVITSFSGHTVVLKNRPVPQHQQRRQHQQRPQQHRSK
ncbi:hypothetical protein BgiMline_031333 [Biomphalaria glabrata]|nr:hypothetical protein BgiMline_019577 [Biomphalaria glabrata]